MEGIFKYMGRHATFTFGRFQPPTIKHKILIDSVVHHANGGEYYLFISTLQDNENNPLDYYAKISFLRILFPYISAHIVQNKKIKDIYGAAMYLKRLGYDDITFVCDINMVEKVKAALESQNNKIYKFNSIKVVSGNVKESYSDDLVQSYIKTDNLDGFKKLIPNNDKLATEIFNTIKGTTSEPTNVNEVKSAIKSLIKKMLNEEDYDEKDKPKITNLKKKTASDEVREKQAIEKSAQEKLKKSQETEKILSRDKSPETAEKVDAIKKSIEDNKKSADNAKKATAATKMKLSSIK